jgi:uncharacterized membrane protein YgcG
MSAHYGAPGFRRAQLAAPSYTASPQGSAVPARSGGTRVVRRKALFVAVATLCAPAFAALALAAIGATGGGERAAMGSLAGNEGLRGTTTPSLISPPAATQHKQDTVTDEQGTATRKGEAGDSPSTHQVQKQPASKAPPPAPVHRPAPKTRPPHVAPPRVNTPSLPTSDPSQPGAPTSSGTSSGSGGTSGSGSGPGTTSGSGSSDHGGSGGTVDGYDAYSGGG